jgi:hypothetical protein
MLRSTFSQMASISGRAILAIGLTSATVLALAPSAKAADNVFIENAAITDCSFAPTTATGTGNGLALSGSLAATTLSGSVGTLTVFSNSPGGFDVSVTSTNVGLKNGSNFIPYKVTVGSLGQTSGDVSATPQTLTGPILPTGGSGTPYVISVAVAKSALVGVPAGAYSDNLVLTATSK